MIEHKGTILVVDDESDSLRLLTDILTTEGYQVRPANTGQLALASIAREYPELILLDVRMPGMDGFEVCRRVKQSEESRRIPLIFASALTNEEEHVEGLALGAVDFITKPIRREELLARVRTHLELGRLRNHLEIDVGQRTVELRESEERFQTMADAAPVLIWASGIDKLCTFVNRGWLEFTGRNAEQELGNGWTESVHSDDRERSYATYCSAFDARRNFEMEYRLRRADGKYRWFLDRGTPRFSGGVFLGYVGSCLDISDLKRAQEEALSRQKLESMGLMATGIAHDFNNLLGTILASADLLSTEQVEGLSSVEEVDRIKTAAIRGAELIRELMIYAGHESPAFEPVNFEALVNEMLHLLKVAISKRVTLKTDLGKDLPPVRASSSQLRQLVLNLITNASDAIGDRAGEIRISAQLVKIAGEPAASLPDGDYLRLEVSDTGSGMTREVRPRIFDPFFSTKETGRGLGLAVVHGIIRTHGGAINVTSKSGKGTTFEVLLPCANGLPRDRSLRHS
jgi:two-component system cell cycle sensor histidine kinase/response regulator CckA